MGLQRRPAEWGVECRAEAGEGRAGFLEEAAAEPSDSGEGRGRILAQAGGRPQVWPFSSPTPRHPCILSPFLRLVP